MTNHDHLIAHAQEGYVDKSEEYLFSSARDYEHDKKCESLAMKFTT